MCIRDSLDGLHHPVVVEEGRAVVDQAIGLVLDGFNHPRMGMPDVAHRAVAVQVDVLVAVNIGDRRAVGRGDCEV